MSLRLFPNYCSIIDLSLWLFYTADREFVLVALKVDAAGATENVKNKNPVFSI
jgi:hypothetical protein